MGLGNTLCPFSGETAKSQGKRNEFRKGERSGGNDESYLGTGKGETGLLTMEYNLKFFQKLLDPQETVIQSEVGQERKTNIVH